MTKTPAAHVQPLDALRRDLLARRAHNNPPTPWRALAADYPGVPAGTLCAISKGREPRKASVRRALGLPVLVAVPACGKCGVVHVRVTCPPATKPSAPRRAPLNRRKLAVKLLGLLWG